MERLASFRTMAQVELDLGSGVGGGPARTGHRAGGARATASRRSSAGRGHVVLLGGEAGRRQDCARPRFCDRRTAPGRGSSGGACEPLFAPRPLGPLLGIAEAVGGDSDALVDDGAMPYQVAGALSSEELGARSHPCLVLEDLHWADEATLDVFRLLARRIETVPRLLVASYRDDGARRADPLRIVLGELATSPRRSAG